MSLDLYSLRVVLAVEECASYTRAAQKLGITQPAVSRRIVGMEQLLHAKLFKREGHRFLPTEVGLSVCDYARQIVLLVDELPNSAQELSHNPTGPLALGVPTRLGEVLLPKLIPAYQKKYPHVFLRIEEGGADFSDMLISNKVDVALIYGKPISSMIEVTPLLHHELGLLYPKSWETCGPHGLPLPKQLALSDIAELPLIVPSMTQGMRLLIADTFHTANLTPNIVMEVNGVRLVGGLISAGVGCSFALQAAIRSNSDRAAFGFSPLHDPAIRWTLSVAVRKLGRPNLAARLMIRMIESMVAELIETHEWQGQLQSSLDLE